MKKRIAGYLIALMCLPVVAQKITMEDIWVNYKYYQRPLHAPQWMKDSRYYTIMQDQALLKMETTTAEVVDTLYVGEESFTDYQLSFGEDKILFQGALDKIYRRSYKAGYYLYDIETKSLDTLTEETVMHGGLSPDGAYFAYVDDNNIYVKDLQKDQLAQVTEDGKWNYVINGNADWVYEEEFMFSKAYFWSPDSRKIAFMKFDESDVPEYHMQVWGDDLYPQDYSYKYPKAGENASKVSVWVFDIVTGKTIHVYSSSEKEYYIPKVQWVNKELVAVSTLNRQQNELNVYHCSSSKADAFTLFTKVKNDKYLEVEEPFHYLDQTTTAVYVTEQGQINKCADGKCIPLKGIKGNVEKVLKATKGSIFYEAISDDNGLERNLYQWKSGKAKCLTCFMKGTNTAEVSPDGQYIFNKNSTINQPAKYTVHHLNDIENPIVELNKMRDMLYNFFVESNFSKVEFHEVKNAAGQKINAYMVKPKDFDPKKQYPVLMYVYGGPGHQLVKNEWQGMNMAYNQLLAQEGYMVVCVDGRGTGGKGEAFKKCTYKQLGKLESDDQIHVANYLKTLSFVDKERIGIWGWSYGGYLSSICLFKGSDVFKMGIAVAPVTNWRYYDNIYTERYMMMPEQNAQGYDKNSPIAFAEQLKGKFLLIHGTADDNVHLQNSIALQQALLNADKQFDVFYYPDKNHGIYGGNTRYNLYNKMLEYIKSNL